MPEVILTSDYRKRRIAAQIPGAYWDAGRNAWVIDPALHPEGAALAGRLFPDVKRELDYASDLEAIRPTDLATPWYLDVHGSTPVHDGAMGLYPYQVVDTAFLVERLRADGGAYLGWERGLGKTRGTIELMQALPALNVVVVCSNDAKEDVWEPEFPKWDFYIPRHVVGNTKAARERAYDRWHRTGGALLIHYEALRLMDWGSAHPDLVVFDEAHRLAHGGNSRQNGVPRFYRALQSIDTRYKVALSGSIIVNGVEDLFGPLHWLFPKRYRARWRDWNDRYIRQISGSSSYKVLAGPIPDRIPQMRQELGAFMTVRRKQDELEGLPEVIETYRHVDLSPVQRRVYDDLAQRMTAELPDGTTINTPTVLAQLGKLRQVASGLDLLGETFQDSSKLDVMEELVQEVLPGKCVVWGWHRATVEAAAARLAGAKVPAVIVHGGVSRRGRNEALAAFHHDPETKVLIATIGTLGESVSLGEAQDCVFVELTWTPAQMEQARDRVAGGLRQAGKSGRIAVTYIVARDTVDEYRVLPTLKSKAAVRKLILGT